ncbi:DUF721 domain-containing protein [Membranihabitans maritimus]|uniref:DUF721 domain-containing protein n=1 Tax=Membranihabitans maritimus TaxID=2904244 RepID=UPI001F44DF7C|nr:DUF721 domain-containing protein [Membranihabitans maritimus]
MSKDFTNIKNILSGISRDPRYSSKLDEKRIEQVWEESNSPFIVSRTEKVSFRDGKLLLFINSAPLKQELFNSRPLIIKKINDALGQEVVKEIVIR